MSFPLPVQHNRTQGGHHNTLFRAISQLEDLADVMRSDDLDTEAASLETTIRDLHWQYEKLIDKELTGQWQNGPRRPLRLTN